MFTLRSALTAPEAPTSFSTTGTKLASGGSWHVEKLSSEVHGEVVGVLVLSP